MIGCPHGFGSRWACGACSALDDAKDTNHGISPAQLREKVEALEAKLFRSDDISGRDARELASRLDAALKRIGALELQLATIDQRTFAELARDMNRPSAPIDQEDV